MYSSSKSSSTDDPAFIYADHSLSYFVSQDPYCSSTATIQSSSSSPQRSVIDDLIYTPVTFCIALSHPATAITNITSRIVFDTTRITLSSVAALNRNREEPYGHPLPTPPCKRVRTRRFTRLRLRGEPAQAQLVGVTNHRIKQPATMAKPRTKPTRDSHRKSFQRSTSSAAKLAQRSDQIDADRHRATQCVANGRCVGDFVVKRLELFGGCVAIDLHLH